MPKLKQIITQLYKLNLQITISNSHKPQQLSTTITHSTQKTRKIQTSSTPDPQKHKIQQKEYKSNQSYIETNTTTKTINQTYIIEYINNKQRSK